LINKTSLKFKGLLSKWHHGKNKKKPQAEEICAKHMCGKGNIEHPENI
jgi:hypothetical protein